MKNNIQLIRSILLILILTTSQSCTKDDFHINDSTFKDGFFIAKGGMSIYDEDGEVNFVGDRKYIKNIFSESNNQTLEGDLISMSVFGDRAYLVSDDSYGNSNGTVKVVNTGSFKEISTIYGIENPGYSIVNKKKDIYF